MESVPYYCMGYYSSYYYCMGLSSAIAEQTLNAAQPGSICQALIHDRFSHTHAQVQALATQRNLAMEQIEIMGGGVMEWRRERDRHLCIYSGYLAQVGI